MQSILQNVNAKTRFLVAMGFASFIPLCGNWLLMKPDALTASNDKYFLLVALSVVIVVLTASYFIERVLDPVDEALEAVERMCQGGLDFSFSENIQSDKLGKLLEKLRELQESSAKHIEIEQQQYADHDRYKSAVDQVTTNLMIADQDFNIVYLNKSAQALFSRNERDFRTVLPAFDAQ